ncbi:MAG: hypothetical protein FWD32_00560, partial [Firmicutes bacterium]|nr:hypothetical protein [Bacillota bacterium]
MFNKRKILNAVAIMFLVALFVSQGVVGLLGNGKLNLGDYNGGSGIGQGSLVNQDQIDDAMNNAMQQTRIGTVESIPTPAGVADVIKVYNVTDLMNIGNPQYVPTGESLSVNGSRKWRKDGRYQLATNITIASTSNFAPTCRAGAGVASVTGVDNYGIYGGFSGHLDGGGFTITVTGNVTSTFANFGIIGYATMGAVFTGVDVVFTTASTWGGPFNQQGVIVGRAEEGTRFYNCKVRQSNPNTATPATVVGNEYVGGFAGYLLHGSIIEGCSSNINVRGLIVAENSSSTGGYIGGFAGRIGREAQIRESYVYGANVVVEGSINYTGGFTGRLDYEGNVQDSYVDIKSVINNSKTNNAATGSGQYVGGYVGYNHSSVRMLRTYSTADVVGNSLVGGHTGAHVAFSTSNTYYSWASGNVTGTWRVGGFVGSANQVNFNDCYATGNVTVHGSHANDYTNSQAGRAGGFAGDTSTTATKFRRCYSTGNVYSSATTGIVNIGSFIGYVAYVTEVSGCWTAGAVSTATRVSAEQTKVNRGIVAGAFRGNALDDPSATTVRAYSVTGGFFYASDLVRYNNATFTNALGNQYAYVEGRGVVNYDNGLNNHTTYGGHYNDTAISPRTSAVLKTAAAYASTLNPTNGRYEGTGLTAQGASTVSAMNGNRDHTVTNTGATVALGMSTVVQYIMRAELLAFPATVADNPVEHNNRNCNYNWDFGTPFQAVGTYAANGLSARPVKPDTVGNSWTFAGSTTGYPIAPMPKINPAGVRTPNTHVITTREQLMNIGNGYLTTPAGGYGGSTLAVVSNTGDDANTSTTRLRLPLYRFDAQPGYHLDDIYILGADITIANTPKVAHADRANTTLITAYNNAVMPQMGWIPFTGKNVTAVGSLAHNSSTWASRTATNPFGGILNGNGYKISITGDVPTFAFGGIIGYSTHGHMRNINVEYGEDATFGQTVGAGGSFRDNYGTIVAYSARGTTVLNCHITNANNARPGKIIGNSYVGGIFGRTGNHANIIKNCSSYIDVQSSGSVVGGIAGGGANDIATYVAIYDSYFQGNISFKRAYHGHANLVIAGSSGKSIAADETVTWYHSYGGIIGRTGLDSTVQRSGVVGNISGPGNVGGIIGWAFRTTPITDCFAYSPNANPLVTITGSTELAADSFVVNSTTYPISAQYRAAGGIVGRHQMSSSNRLVATRVIVSGDIRSTANANGQAPAAGEVAAGHVAIGGAVGSGGMDLRDSVINVGTITTRMAAVAGATSKAATGQAVVGRIVGFNTFLSVAGDAGGTVVSSAYNVWVLNTMRYIHGVNAAGTGGTTVTFANAASSLYGLNASGATASSLVAEWANTYFPNVLQKTSTLIRDQDEYAKTIANGGLSTWNFTTTWAMDATLSGTPSLRTWNSIEKNKITVIFDHRDISNATGNVKTVSTKTTREYTIGANLNTFVVPDHNPTNDANINKWRFVGWYSATSLTTGHLQISGTHVSGTATATTAKVLQPDMVQKLQGAVGGTTITLFARYEATLNYHALGATNQSYLPSALLTRQVAHTMPTAANTAAYGAELSSKGWSHVNWYWSATAYYSSSPGTAVSISTSASSMNTFEAQMTSGVLTAYARIQSTITYNVQGGTAVTAGTRFYGAAFNWATTATKTGGYTFGGWFTSQADANTANETGNTNGVYIPAAFSSTGALINTPIAANDTNGSRTVFARWITTPTWTNGSANMANSVYNNNTAYSHTLPGASSATPTGGGALSFTYSIVSGAPAGYTINSTSGVISSAAGNVTAQANETTGYNIVVRATANNGRTVDRTFNLIINRAQRAHSLFAADWTYGSPTRPTISPTGPFENPQVSYQYALADQAGADFGNMNSFTWIALPTDLNTLNSGDYLFRVTIAASTNYAQLITYAQTDNTNNITKINRATRSHSVIVTNWTYAGTNAYDPQLNGSVLGNPSINYFYSTKQDFTADAAAGFAVGGKPWPTSLTSTSIDSGTYYVGAVIGETINHAEQITTAPALVISKATRNNSLQGLQGWEYNSGTQVTVSDINNTIMEQGDASFGGITFWYFNFGANISTASQTVPTNPGSYMVFARIGESKNYNLLDTAAVQFSIGRMSITRPAFPANPLNPTFPNRFTYNENPFTVVLTGTHGGNTIVLTNPNGFQNPSDFYELGGVTTRTNIGSYSFTVNLKDTAFYRWDDGSDGAHTLTWQITVATITADTAPIKAPGKYAYGVTIANILADLNLISGMFEAVEREGTWEIYNHPPAPIVAGTHSFSVRFNPTNTSFAS